MTTVTVIRSNGHITSVEAEGHAGFAAKGEDIVCAAVSSLLQTALLGLLRVAGIACEYESDEKKGYLLIKLPELSGEDRHNADMILETMLCGIADLNEGYSDFIELEVKTKCL